MMSCLRWLVPLLFLRLSVGLSAQPVDTCVFVVPATVTLTSSAQATCNCRVPDAELKVYSRWGKEVFVAKELQGFPQNVLLIEGLQSGTYFWTISATVIQVGEAHELKQQGYLNVLK